MYQNFDDNLHKPETPHRLEQLRIEMKNHPIDALIVPHEDEFMNEYLPEAHERLAWLTGFDGSAGCALITPKHAFLCVDGRYVLQAKNQTDSNLFTIIDITQTNLIESLLANIPPSSTIGFVPQLHSHTQIKTFRQTGEKKKITLKPLAENPIDAIWKTREKVATSPLSIHPLELCGQTSLEKREKIAQDLRNHGQEVVLLTRADSIAWLLNIRATDTPHTPLALCFLVLKSNKDLVWFIDEARLTEKILEHIGGHIELKAPEQMAEYLTKSQTPIQLDPHHATESLVACLGDKARFATDPCSLPKACKNDAEIKGARHAHIRDGAALCQFLCWLDKQTPKADISEIQAAQKLESYRQASGKLKDLSFDTISATGAHGAIIHYRVTQSSNEILKDGQLYLVDSGGQYQDGTTDVTRTVLIGASEADKQIKDIFTRVLKGHIALAMAVFPHGTKGQALDTIARMPLWEIGLDFAHGTGHGVGSFLSVHEGPQNISKHANVALKEGMILSNEPGYYRENAFGIRIENLQFVRPHTQFDMLCFEQLTYAPIDFRLINASLLSAQECDWLNQYHAQTYAHIAPLVGDETKNWLKQACAELRQKR